MLAHEGLLKSDKFLTVKYKGEKSSGKVDHEPSNWMRCFFNELPPALGMGEGPVSPSIYGLLFTFCASQHLQEGKTGCGDVPKTERSC